MIFQLNLQKAVFKLMQSLTSKLQLNGFLFSRKVNSSCSWWRSDRCLCLALRTFYLFRLMYSVYLSQGLYPFLTLLQLVSGASSWIVHGTLWCIQLRQITPSYRLCCLADVQYNVPTLVPLIHRYIYHCMNNPTGTLQDDIQVVASVCFDIGCFVSSCQMWSVYLFKFFPNFWFNIS